MPELVGTFEFMINTERLIQLENDVDRHNDRKCLEKMKKITLLVSNSFHSLNVSKYWSIPSNHRHRIVTEFPKWKIPCDNCGGEYYSPDFPHPCDKEKIKKYKEERASPRVGGGHGGGSGCRRGVVRQGGRKKLRNDKKDGDRNDYGNCFQNRGNDCM